MAILPVDIQALMIRMNDVSKPHQREYEGAVLTQMSRAEEVAKTAQLESTRVNEVKPHPDGNSKIEPDGGKKGSSGRKNASGGREGPSGSGKAGGEPRGSAVQRPPIEDPYRGKIIDTKV